MRPSSLAGGCALGGCGMWLLCLVLALAIAGFCFDYSLYSYFGKDIPWYGDCVAGLFTAPINIPATVVAYVLRCCGMEPPFIDLG
jgi:hypothetical protein